MSWVHRGRIALAVGVAGWLGAWVASGQPAVAGGSADTNERHSDQDNCIRPGGAYGEDLVGREDGLRRLYVKADAAGQQNGRCWRDAYRDLQDALDHARAQSEVAEIWVARGVYRPARGSGSRAESFRLVDGVRVYGGFVGNETLLEQRNPDPLTNGTRLSGDLLDDDAAGNRQDNSYNVVSAIGLSSGAVLDGFTVSGGFADGTRHQAQGGAVHISAADVRIDRCLLAGNAAVEGGAIYIDSGSPLLRGCIVRDNAAQRGGALHVVGGAPRVEFATFLKNQASESGGDVLAGGAAETLLLHTRLLGGGAVRGGSLAAGEDGLIEAVNCVITGAQAAATGGAVQLDGRAIARLINCTVVDNSAAATGGVYATAQSAAFIQSTILWANHDVSSGLGEAAQLALDAAALADVQYSCLTGWSGKFGGVGNHGDDPAFVAPDGGLAADLALRPDSPCIDAGNSDAFGDALMDKGLGHEYEVDLGLEHRFTDDPDTRDKGVSSYGLPVVDIGAFEYQASSD